MPKAHVPAVGCQQHARGVIEQYAAALVRQLEAEAVLVGVIHPLGHPHWLGLLLWGWVSICDLSKASNG